MKHFLVLVVLLNSLSCTQEKKASVQPVKTNYVDDIPFLMTEMKIDSVLEIVTYGSLGSAVENDTLNCYVSRGNNTISQKLKSLMCCYYTYQYDDLGMLSKKSILTDYSTAYDLSYKRDGNTITVVETGSYNDSNIHNYSLEDERIIAKSSTHNIDDAYTEDIKYFYNSKGQLTKRHSEAKNDPNNEFDYKVMLKAYSWNDSILKETRLNQFYNDGKDFYETITTFDTVGFPASRIIMENKDTICKTLLVKIQHPK